MALSADTDHWRWLEDPDAPEVKVWVKRNGVYRPYKAKEPIAAQLKMGQLEGHSSGQVEVVITSNGLQPSGTGGGTGTGTPAEARQAAAGQGGEDGMSLGTAESGAFSPEGSPHASATLLNYENEKSPASKSGKRPADFDSEFGDGTRFRDAPDITSLGRQEALAAALAEAALEETTKQSPKKSRTTQEDTQVSQPMDQDNPQQSSEDKEKTTSDTEDQEAGPEEQEEELMDDAL